MPEPLQIISHSITVYEELDKLWGAARLGLILTAAHYHCIPVGTEELAERTELSTETVRRKIKPLWNVGRIEAIREGRNISYVATEQWAKLTCEMIEKSINGAGYIAPG